IFQENSHRGPIGNVATTEVQGPFSAESPESGKSTSFPSMDGLPGGYALNGAKMETLL
nr:hypothetical protein [Tanacetum cinerariifolium]